MTSAVFRIRKRYFDAIVSGKKTVEFRKDSDYWRKRLKPSLDTAVFICGKRVHRPYGYNAAAAAKGQDRSAFKVRSVGLFE